MTTTPLPQPGPIIKYGAVWTIKKGDAINGEDNTLSRDENGIPINESSTGGRPGEETTTTETSWFHTQYKWDNTEIKYSSLDASEVLKLSGYEIEVKVFGLRQALNSPEDPNPEEYEFAGFVPFRVNSFSLESTNPNGNKPWVYPDEFDTIEDPRHPKQYGGVIVFSDNTPKTVSVGDTFDAGLDDGPNNDGLIPWTTTLNENRNARSEYNYLQVFDQAKFSYIPRNSLVALEQSSSVQFQTTPLYPDVKDVNGKAAPIYPMNALAAFLPDGRERVTVTYTAKMDVVALVNNNPSPISIENNEVTIKQTVEQDTSDYIDQLNALGRFCQFENPGGWSDDELSPNYNYDYPYTLVNGFDGLAPGATPTTRADGSELQKGDVWYNPSTNERKTWSEADIPQSVSVIEGGTGYKSKENAMCIWMIETDENGFPLKTFSVDDYDEIPSGLYVNYETENGKVVSASINDVSDARNWNNGDMVKVVGGNNNCTLKINIPDGPGWSDNFIDKY